MKMITKLSLISLVALCTVMVASAQIRTVVSVTGYVFDETNRKPVDGILVTFTNDKGRKVSSKTSRGGYYYIAGLKPGENYTYKVSGPKYADMAFRFKAPNTNRYAEISRDILIKPLKKGVSIPLATSPFELRKSKLRTGAEELLDQYKTLLKLNPKVKIQIVSYPDEKKASAENMKLTKERATAVMKYLEQNGIGAERMSVKANGDIDPKNPLPTSKRAKGKRYKGKTYMVITQV